MVDDESKPERRPTKHSPIPAEWNSKHNCAYSYYAYYIVSRPSSTSVFYETILLVERNEWQILMPDQAPYIF